VLRPTDRLDFNDVLQSSLLGYAALELLPSFLISTSLTVAGNVRSTSAPLLICVESKTRKLLQTTSTTLCALLSRIRSTIPKSINSAYSSSAQVWINQGDTILISLGDLQDVKAHVIQKYTSDEARNLKAYGELPENGQIDETDTFGPGEDAEFNFKSRRTPEDLVIPDM
ncbi:hypothetical protein PSHT_02719, partial [Puccinia striiformis]